MSRSRGVTPQYRIIKQLTPDLTNAVKNDLCDLSNRLLSHGLITEENHEEFTNDKISRSKRASDLIRTVLERIKSDVRHYTVFVGVLEQNELYYSSVLQKIRSHHEGIVVICQPTFSQTHPSYSREQHSDGETSPFLHTPYLQYEDDYRNPNVRRKPSWHLKQLRDFLGLIRYTTHCKCSDVLVTISLFGVLAILFIIFVSAVVFIVSSTVKCDNKLYFVALTLVFMASFLLLTCNLMLMCDRVDGSLLFSIKQTIFFVLAPWLLIFLVWFIAYKYMCTT